jgi:putative membrane protein
MTEVDDARVRDHLANERTYLAWLRTGVSTLGLGVVIAKLRYLIGPNYAESSGIVHAANIGLVFAVTGLLTIIWSVFFFLRTRDAIRKGTYISGSKLEIALAAVLVALGCIIIWYLLQPTK